MEERNLITLDNLTVDADTGEIVSEHQEFHITDDKSLSWWLGKMRQLRALAHSEWEVGNKAMNRSQVFHRAADGLEQRFREEAEPVVRALLPKGRRSVLFEGGEAGLRKTPGHLDVTDELAAVAWCKEHLPEAVKVFESILKTPVTKQYDETEVLPPGVAVVAPSEKLWVK